MDLLRRPRTMLKTLYFSRDHQFFQVSQGITFLYDRGRKPFSFIGRGGIIFDQGTTLSKIINQESHRGASHWATWTGCLYKCTPDFWIKEIIRKRNVKI